MQYGSLWLSRTEMGAKEQRQCPFGHVLKDNFGFHQPRFMFQVVIRGSKRCVVIVFHLLSLVLVILVVTPAPCGHSCMLLNMDLFTETSW